MVDQIDFVICCHMSIEQYFQMLCKVRMLFLQCRNSFQKQSWSSGRIQMPDINHLDLITAPRCNRRIIQFRIKTMWKYDRLLCNFFSTGTEHIFFLIRIIENDLIAVGKNIMFQCSLLFQCLKRSFLSALPEQILHLPDRRDHFPDSHLSYIPHL